MMKLIKLLTIISVLGLVSCGENPNKRPESTDITSSFLNTAIGDYQATSLLNTCPGNTGIDGDSCDEFFTLEGKGKFSRVYFRKVGVNGSLVLPLGLLCKWTERGTIYRVLELDADTKNLPQEITHIMYSVVDSVEQEENNPVACRNFFNAHFLPYSLKMYSTISSQGLKFHTYGEPLNNQRDRLNAQSTRSDFQRINQTQN